MVQNVLRLRTVFILQVRKMEAMIKSEQITKAKEILISSLLKEGAQQ